jgi:hypothetical protein
MVTAPPVEGKELLLIAVPNKTAAAVYLNRGGRGFGDLARCQGEGPDGEKQKQAELR